MIRLSINNNLIKNQSIDQYTHTYTDLEIKKKKIVQTYAVCKVTPSASKWQITYLL